MIYITVNNILNLSYNIIIVNTSLSGFLFEPGNVEDLTEKINKLWNDPALCKRLGKNAREFVVKNFGPEEHPACSSYAVSIAGRYEKLMEIYRRAIEKHK